MSARLRGIAIGRGPGGAQADVDELDRARVPGAGVDEQAGLDQVPKVTVTSARTAAPRHRPGVGVDAAGQVDGDHGGAGLTGLLGRGPARRTARAGRPDRRCRAGRR